MNEWYLINKMWMFWSQSSRRSGSCQRAKAITDRLCGVDLHVFNTKSCAYLKVLNSKPSFLRARHKKAFKMTGLCVELLFKRNYLSSATHQWNAVGSPDQKRGLEKTTGALFFSSSFLQTGYTSLSLLAKPSNILCHFVSSTFSSKSHQTATWLKASKRTKHQPIGWFHSLSLEIGSFSFPLSFKQLNKPIQMYKRIFFLRPIT